MKVQKVICTLLFCLSSISLATAQQDYDLAFYVGAFKIRLSADKLVIALNDPVTIKTTTTNISKKPLDLPSEPAVWSIRREDGRPVADTMRGRKRKEAQRAPQTAVVAPLLEPGASLTGEETISNLYVMNEPGVYIVSLQVPVSDGKKTDFIRSNTLRITIQ